MKEHLQTWGTIVLTDGTEIKADFVEATPAGIHYCVPKTDGSMGPSYDKRFLPAIAVAEVRARDPFTVEEIGPRVPTAKDSIVHDAVETERSEDAFEMGRGRGESGISVYERR